MLLQLPQILFFLRKRHLVFARRGFRINLMALVKDTLVQPQSEREAVLTGREPSQAMGTICEKRRG